MRAFSPDSSRGKWRTFLQCNAENTTDGSLFVNTSNKVGGGIFYPSNGNYTRSFSAGSWHTLTVTIEDGRQSTWIDGFLACANNDRSLAGKAFDLTGNETILIAADDSGDDYPLYFTSIEIYDEALIPDQTGRGLPVGLWEFNSENPLKATIGQDLVEAGSASNSTSVPGTGTFQDVDGITFGDGAQRVGHRSHYRLTHGIPIENQPAFTIVMDIRTPASSMGTWRSIFGVYPDNRTEGSLYINSSNNIGYSAGSFGSYKNFNCTADAWYRVVVSSDTDYQTLWVNGEQISSVSGPQGYRLKLGYPEMLLFNDDNGEDRELDVSTVMLFDYALNEREIRAYHSAPLPTGEGVVEALPRGEWLMSDGISEGRIPALLGEDLLVVESRENKVTASADAVYIPQWTYLTWDRTGLDGEDFLLNDYTYVFDILRPAESQGWLALYQTVPANNKDGSFFLNNSNCFWTRSTGTTYSGINSDEWVRVVVSVSLGNVSSVYVNGELFDHDFAVSPGKNGDFAQKNLLHFFADDNGQHSGVYCRYLAAYDRALSPFEAASLGTPRAEPPAEMPQPEQLTIRPLIAYPDGEVTFELVHLNGLALVTMDFGDGSSEMSENFTDTVTEFAHTYLQTGAYPILVRMRNPGGDVTDWIEVGSVKIHASGILITLY